MCSFLVKQSVLQLCTSPWLTQMHDSKSASLKYLSHSLQFHFCVCSIGQNIVINFLTVGTDCESPTTRIFLHLPSSTPVAVQHFSVRIRFCMEIHLFKLNIIFLSSKVVQIWVMGILNGKPIHIHVKFIYVWSLLQTICKQLAVILNWISEFAEFSHKFWG